jgi:CRISPR-associated protein Cmr2
MNVAYLQAEAERILGRKERKGLKLPLFESRQDLLDYAKELVVARFLSGVKTENQPEVSRA